MMRLINLLGGEKSNQVSIAGHVEGVEAARKAIRRLLPLVLAFDFQVGVATRGIVVPSVDANHPLIQRIQQVVDVVFRTAEERRLDSSI